MVVAAIDGDFAGFCGRVCGFVGRNAASKPGYRYRVDADGYVGLGSRTPVCRAVAAKHHLPALTGVQNLFGSLLLLPFATPSGRAAAMHNSVFSWSLRCQVIVVSVVAMLMWFQLRAGSAHAAAFHLPNPIFATLLARLFFHIPPGRADIAGTLPVVIALGILNRQDIKQAGAAKHP